MCVCLSACVRVCVCCMYGCVFGRACVGVFVCELVEYVRVCWFACVCLYGRVLFV